MDLTNVEAIYIGRDLNFHVSILTTYCDIADKANNQAAYRYGAPE